MKKSLFSFAAILMCAVTFVACKSNSPKATAEKFLNSFYHMDYETAKTVSTEETKATIELMAQFSSIMTDSMKAEAKKIKVTIKDEKIEGDKATVTYTLSEDGDKMERKLNLVKAGEDDKKNKGKWLASWSKDEGMGGADDAEMTEPATDETMPMDTAVAPPADAMIDTVVR